MFGKKKQDPERESVQENTRPDHFLDDMSESFYRLARVLEAEALEMVPGEGEEEGCLMIPYMMNDAIEYILVLTNANVTGEYCRGIGLADAEILQAQKASGDEKDRFVLTLTMTDRSKCSVFFDGIREKVRTFACHEIGHFWVPGAEQWRRAVYIIGTIHDKYEYFGDEFCNEKEQELMWLMEFGPLRDWSPIGESIRERYPSSRQGTEAMLAIAEEVGDTEYSSLLRKYKRFPWKHTAEQLHRKLQEPARWPLWNRIRQKITESQEGYARRDYGEEKNRRIQMMREQTDLRLKALGFTGTYPNYAGRILPPADILRDLETDRVEEIREAAAAGGLCSDRLVLVCAAEEHPFTELDRPDYTFEIQLMVSEGPESRMKTEKGYAWNLGFFEDDELNSMIFRP